MIYLLKCGNCLLDFKVELKEARAEWTCANCGELQITSPPVDKLGALIEDIGFGSIIGKEAADVPGDPKEIISGAVLDDGVKKEAEAVKAEEAAIVDAIIAGEDVKFDEVKP